MKKLVKLIVMIAVISVLAACTSTSTPATTDNKAVTEITAIVDAFKGRSDLIVKTEAEKNGTLNVLATGTIDAEGLVKITLPNDIATNLLVSFEADDGCEVSPSNVMAYFVLALSVYAGDQGAGLLSQMDANSSLNRVFVTEDADIVCTNTAANASFKKGWNLVSFDNATQIGKILPSSTAPWTFTGSLPNPTNPNPTNPNPTNPNPTNPSPSDTTAPTLISSKSTSNTTVELVFSEAVEGADNIAAYGIIDLVSSNLQTLTILAASVSADKTKVTLTTASQQNTSYGITSIALKDAAGNNVDLPSSGSGPLNFFGTAIATGNLSVTVSGLPTGVAANISVTGPNSFSKTLSGSETLIGLSSGTYNFSISPVSPDSATYSDNGSIKSVVFDATTSGSAALNYACSAVNPPDSGLDKALKTATSKETYNCADLENLIIVNAIAENISDLEGLQYAKNITVLNLTNNAITTIPSAIISKLTKLTLLQLQSNQLSSVSASDFSGLANLETLYLFNNNISSIGDNTFANLAALKNLQLQNNGLSGLSTNSFGGLNNLEELYLFSNSLATLPYGVFANLQKLNKLELQDNCISPKAIPTEGIIAEATTVTSLDTSSNPKAGCATNTLPEWKAYTGTSGLALAGSYVHPTVPAASNPVPLALCRGSYNGTVFVGEAYFVINDVNNQKCRLVTFDGQKVASSTEMLYGGSSNLLWRDITDGTFVAQAKQQAVYTGKFLAATCSAAHAGGRHLGFVLSSDNKCYIGYDDGDASTPDTLAATSYRVLVDTNK